MKTSWNGLKALFETLLPNNIKQIITPLRVRTALSALVDAIEGVIQFATPVPVKREIIVTQDTQRNWQIQLSASSNTIGFFAFTTQSKRTLILGEDFEILGSGTNRTFAISNPTVDNFKPGEKIIFTENVRGALINFRIPEYVLRNNKIGWIYPDAPEEFYELGSLGIPQFSPARSITLTSVTNQTIYTHNLASRKLFIGIQDSEGKALSYVSAKSLDDNRIQFDLEDGATIPSLTLFIFVFA